MYRKCNSKLTITSDDAVAHEADITKELQCNTGKYNTHSTALWYAKMTININNKYKPEKEELCTLQFFWQ